MFRASTQQTSTEKHRSGRHVPAPVKKVGTHVMLHTVNMLPLQGFVPRDRRGSTDISPSSVRWAERDSLPYHRKSDLCFNESPHPGNRENRGNPAPDKEG